MSGFGRPPSKILFSPTPPKRGSFPLDHDGECRSVMKDYLTCLKKAHGTNNMECRLIARAYLQCRMDNHLMAPDEFKNLGFQDEGLGKEQTEVKKEKKPLSRLEELKKENKELVEKHAADK